MYLVFLVITPPTSLPYFFSHWLVFSQESLLCTGAVSIQGLLILFGFPYLDEICQESGGLTIWPFLLGSLVLRVDLILLSE